MISKEAERGVRMSLELQVTNEVYREVIEFLHTEAELLDDGKFRQWLDLLDERISYRVPIRLSRERTAGPGFSENSHHMIEDRGSLEVRVFRLETEYAWAEDPPSRTRHFVSNIRVEPGDNADEIKVKSNLFLYRDRSDTPEHEFISGERRDVLARRDGALKLRERVVLLDQTTVRTLNLAIFL